MSRELDAEIAEKIFNYKVCVCTDEEIKKWIESFYPKPNTLQFDNFIPCRFSSNNDCNKCGNKYLNVLNYSSDISAAWKIVEKIRETKDPYYPHNLDIKIQQADNLVDGLWLVEIYTSIHNKGSGVSKVWAKSTSVSEAICKAALKTIDKLEK